MRARQAHGRTATPVYQRISQPRGVIVTLCFAVSGLLASCKSAAGGRGGDDPSGVVAGERMRVRVLQDTVRLVADGNGWFVGTADILVSNTSARPLYLEKCGLTQPRFVVEQLADAEWRATYREACPSILAFPTVIGARDSATFRLRLSHTTRPNTSPRFLADDPAGLTRVWVSATRRFDATTMTGGEQVAQEQRVSNSFVLTIAR